MTETGGQFGRWVMAGVASRRGPKCLSKNVKAFLFILLQTSREKKGLEVQEGSRLGVLKGTVA
jgi:hypothetical protein